MERRYVDKTEGSPSICGSTPLSSPTVAPIPSHKNATPKNKYFVANNDNYDDALWNAVAALGDRDTICAIVGSIVALITEKQLPKMWVESREPLTLLV